MSVFSVRVRTRVFSVRVSMCACRVFSCLALIRYVDGICCSDVFVSRPVVVLFCLVFARRYPILTRFRYYVIRDNRCYMQEVKEIPYA